MSSTLQRTLALSAERHGVFTDAMARAEGMSAQAIGRRLRTNEFIRLHPGVLRSIAVPESKATEMQAALDWAGPDSLLAFRTAAGLYGIDNVFDGPVEVWMHGKRRTTGIKCHRLSDGTTLEARRISGFRVTTPERTLWDLASILPQNPLLLAAEDVLRRRFTHLAKLWFQLHDLRRRGCPSVRSFEQMLLSLDPDTAKLRSRFESELKRIINAIGYLAIPDFEVKVGKRRFLIDVAFPDFRLGIEAHSVRWHMVDRMAYDAERQRTLTLAGWTMLYFTWEDVIKRPRSVQREIEQALRQLQTPSPLRNLADPNVS
jgi:very-short-patch-repair endonuclease